MACLSNIIEIDREQCIGNSLPIINDNFTNLKNYICSLENGQQGIINQQIFYVPLQGIINFYGDIVLGGVNFDLNGKGKQNIIQGIDLRSYHLCNGQDGTPDLRDRFVVGSGGSYTHREFGPVYNSTLSLAFSSVRLTVAEMPSHTHNVYAKGPGEADQGDGGYKNPEAVLTPSSSTGGDQPHENRPPYMALAYIMRYI